MKYILTLLLATPLFGAAQNCKLKKETDQFSQQPKLSTGFMSMLAKGTRISLNMVADSKEVKLLFSLEMVLALMTSQQPFFHLIAQEQRVPKEIPVL